MKRDGFGKWRLEKDDLHISPDDMEVDAEAECVTTYIGAWFDVDTRLGTKTHGTDDYINLYAEFHPFNPAFELYYFIHHANGDVSDPITVKDVSINEMDMIHGLMREAGLDELIQGMEDEAEWGDDD